MPQTAKVPVASSAIPEVECWGQDGKGLYFRDFWDANSALHLLPAAGALRTHPALPAAPGLSPV